MSGPLRLVGFEELSAGALRGRLLQHRGCFWSGTALPDDEVTALHDPLFFHQLGGFGAVALTADDQDAGDDAHDDRAEDAADRAASAPGLGDPDGALRGRG